MISYILRVNQSEGVDSQQTFTFESQAQAVSMFSRFSPGIEIKDVTGEPVEVKSSFFNNDTTMNGLISSLNDNNDLKIKLDFTQVEFETPHDLLAFIAQLRSSNISYQINIILNKEQFGLINEDHECDNVDDFIEANMCTQALVDTLKELIITKPSFARKSSPTLDTSNHSAVSSASSGEDDNLTNEQKISKTFINKLLQNSELNKFLASGILTDLHQQVTENQQETHIHPKKIVPFLARTEGSCPNVHKALKDELMRLGFGITEKKVSGIFRRKSTYELSSSDSSHSKESQDESTDVQKIAPASSATEEEQQQQQQQQQHNETASAVNQSNVTEVYVPATAARPLFSSVHDEESKTPEQERALGIVPSSIRETSNESVTNRFPIIEFTFAKNPPQQLSTVRLLRRLESLSTVANPVEIIETETQFTIKARKYNYADTNGLRMMIDERGQVSITHNNQQACIDIFTFNNKVTFHFTETERNRIFSPVDNIVLINFAKQKSLRFKSDANLYTANNTKNEFIEKLNSIFESEPNFSPEEIHSIYTENKQMEYREEIENCSLQTFVRNSENNIVLKSTDRGASKTKTKDHLVRINRVTNGQNTSISKEAFHALLTQVGINDLPEDLFNSIWDESVAKRAGNTNTAQTEGPENGERRSSEGKLSFNTYETLLETDDPKELEPYDENKLAIFKAFYNILYNQNHKLKTKNYVDYVQRQNTEPQEQWKLIQQHKNNFEARTIAVQTPRTVTAWKLMEKYASNKNDVTKDLESIINPENQQLREDLCLKVDAFINVYNAMHMANSFKSENFVEAKISTLLTHLDKYLAIQEHIDTQGTSSRSAQAWEQVERLFSTEKEKDESITFISKDPLKNQIQGKISVLGIFSRSKTKEDKNIAIGLLIDNIKLPKPKPKVS